MPSPWPPRLVVALASLLAVALLSPVLGDQGGDSAQYLLLAESIVSHGSYCDLHLPGAPLHTHYPPGLPLLLAPLVAAFGRDAHLVHRVFVLITGMLALWLAYRWLLRRTNGRHALLVLAVVASGAAWAMQSVRVQSEMPFACALLGFLIEAERRPARRGWLFGWALAAFLLRTAGVFALLAVPFAGRSWRRPQFGWLAASGGTVLGWWLYGQLCGGGTWSYTDEFVQRSGGLAGLPSYLLEGLRFQTSSIAELLGDHPWVGRQPVLAGLLLVPFAIGLVRAWRRPGLAEWVFAGSFALFVLAPGRTHRYLLPWLPYLGLLFVEGLRVAAALLRRYVSALRVRPVLLRLPLGAALALVFVHLLALAPIGAARHKPCVVDAPPLLRAELGEVALEEWEEGWLLPPGPLGQRYARAYGSFLLLLRGVAARVPEDAVLAHRKPRLVAYLTGRLCVPMPDGVAPARLEAELRVQGVTHLVEDMHFLSTRRIFAEAREHLPLRCLLEVRDCRLWQLEPLRAGPR